VRLADRALTALEDHSSPRCIHCFNRVQGELVKDGGHRRCADRDACRARTPRTFSELRARERQLDEVRSSGPAGSARNEGDSR
jgi:hypothetical protein